MEEWVVLLSVGRTWYFMALNVNYNRALAKRRYFSQLLFRFSQNTELKRYAHTGTGVTWAGRPLRGAGLAQW